MQIALLTSLTDVEFSIAAVGNDTTSGINNSGVVVGYSLDDAVRWINDTPSIIWTNGYANGINASGEVVGVQTGANGAPQAVSWINGTLSVLPVASGVSATFAAAVAVNKNGMIIGDVMAGVAGSPASTYTSAGALIWQNGQVTALAQNTSAVALNDSGQVVIATVGANNITQNSIWQNGTSTILSPLVAGDNAYALAINNSGMVVGGDFSDADHQQAVVWTNGSATALPTLSGDTYSFASAINDSGVIVGMAGIHHVTSSEHAVMWINGQITDLNSLLPANSGWTLQAATAINNSNQILGFGDYNDTPTTFTLTLTSGTGTPVIGGSAEVVTDGTPATPLAVVDSASDVVHYIDALETVATAGKLSSISLTDGGIPVLSITAAQLSSDAAAIKLLGGTFTLSETAPTASATVSGASNALGNTMVFSQAAAQYTVTPAGDGVHLTVSGGGTTDILSNFQALQFSDVTLIVAQAPGSAAAPTTGNITELYSAAFGRAPDVPGLAYYQQSLAANPKLSLTTLAQQFLASPEYQNNSAHDYAQTTAGDTQFISDLYTNLLHRAPGSGDAAWYEANVIAPIVGSASPGSAAYTSALALAHATVVTDFSQSSEFLSDVEVTASNPASAKHWLLLI